jgi:hypothetical protein
MIQTRHALHVPGKLCVMREFSQLPLPPTSSRAGASAPTKGKATAPNFNALSVTELKKAVEIAGIHSQAIGFTEKREFIELLTKHSLGGSEGPARHRLGNTIHKKSVAAWQPPRWVFLGDVFARPMPVAAVGPTLEYWVRWLGATPPKSIQGGKFFNTWNWVKLSFLLSVNGKLLYTLAIVNM